MTRTTMAPDGPDRDRRIRQVADNFRMMADPTRIEVLRVLAGGERGLQSLYAATGIGPPAISHHLTLLRIGGVIESRRAGQQSFYRLTELGRRLAEVAKALG